MIIAIIIISILWLLTIIISIYIIRKILDAMAEYGRDMLNAQYAADEIVEMYPCTLVVEESLDDEESVCWDFSQYAEKGIVGMISHTTDPIGPMRNKGETTNGIIPIAYVYKTAGGEFRCFIE